MGIHSPRKCAGNCSVARSAGILHVAGKSPVRFIAQGVEGVELVECDCGRRQDAEERGVAGLLINDKLVASSEEKAPPPQEPSTAKPADNLTVAEELTKLALGFIAARASWVIIKVTDSALLGHVSTDVLAASAYADLWMSSTGVILMGGVLGTFVGNSIGAGNKKQAGLVSIGHQQRRLRAFLCHRGIAMRGWA